jgi:orotate phosphoribosyltransferase
MTLGADPIAYAIAYASASTRTPLRAFTVRKEAKSHGTRRLIEGPFRAGDRVAIVEDVITTGSSALAAAKAVADSGGEIMGILALIDRQEGGRETLEANGFTVIALTSASEITAKMA